jgi:Ca2+-binding EF-hand superfamily protein
MKAPPAVLPLLVLATALIGRGTEFEQPSPDAVRDFVFLADQRPILVRLHVRIDGRPFGEVQRESWDRYYRSLFHWLDRDGNGSLDESEAKRMPPPVGLVRTGARGQTSQVNIAFNFQVVDANGDGRVTLDEMVDYYRHFSADPWSLRFIARQPPIRGQALGDALFQKLDRNQDGKLSREELAAAAQTLGPLMENEDECLLPEDLLVGPAGAAAVAATKRSEPPFALLAPGEDSAKLARRLLARYGPKSDRLAEGKVSRDALGIDPLVFQRLDVDKDGWLSEAELAHFTDRPADINLVLRSGKRAKGQAVLELEASEENPTADWSVAKRAEDAITLRIGDVRLELCGLGDGLEPVIRENRQAFLQRFHDLKRGAKAGISKQDAYADRLFYSLFDFLDRRGAGVLDQPVVEEYLGALQHRQIQAMSSRMQMLVSEEGRGLFDLLDRNRDGRLSRREVSSASSVLGVWQKGGEDGVRREDIPRSYQVVVGPALFEPATLDAEPPGLPMSGWRSAPRWFRKMDRNQDGDISPREFIGSVEQFKKLDADGDGLISIAEAEAADRAARK